MEEIAKILPVLFRKQLRRDSASLVEIIAPLWPRIAGKGIAGQSRPTAFQAGTLTLSAPCPSWAVQLRRMAEELRAAINCYLGCPVVKKVRVQLRAEGRRTEDSSPSQELFVTEAAAVSVLPRPDRPGRALKAAIHVGRASKGDRWH